MNEEFRGLIEAFDRQNEQQKIELRRIMSERNTLPVLTAIHDRYENALLRLAQLSHAIDQRGNSHDIQDIWDELQRDMRATYRDIAGVEYVPEICRARGN